MGRKRMDTLINTDNSGDWGKEKKKEIIQKMLFVFEELISMV